MGGGGRGLNVKKKFFGGYRYVVVQFYPQFNLIFLCFIFIIICQHRKEQWKIKVEPRIKLNFNRYLIDIF